MARLIWLMVVVLAVLHQDVWNWDSKALVLGFIPVGLAYHALYSVAAALMWMAALRWAWPSGVEAWANETGEDGEGSQ
ncbi:MAG: hypothetical protein QF404_08615 [Planctomycetota bacterium]|nr:hypothetical protein [Planctomycetota bacterium]MDP6939186.1 hypothetical protein [Planctomycetota bacterium]